MLLQFKNKTHLHELIEMLFHVMDTNGNGLLEYTDLERGFRHLNIPGLVCARNRACGRAVYLNRVFVGPCVQVGTFFFCIRKEGDT